MASSSKLGTAQLLFNSAQQMGLNPTWIAPNGLFAISATGQERYISFARSPLNSHTAASLARNKHSTRLILERHNMLNIPFARPRTHAEAEAFLSQHGKIIAKPVEGSGARDIHIVTDAAQLEGLRITKYILEKYIAGQEVRYLVLNGQVIGVHLSEYGTSVEATRDLQRVSHEETTWNQVLVSSSLQITEILGLRFAAIDYMIDAADNAYVLEVNTAPGLKWFHAPSSGPVVDVARLFLEAVIADHDAKVS